MAQSLPPANNPDENLLGEEQTSTLPGIAEIQAAFLAKVIWLRQNDSSIIEVNRFPWQSRIIVRELLRKALKTKEEVRAFFSPRAIDFYPRLYRDLDLILSNGNVIKVYLTQPPELDERNEWKSLEAKYPGLLKVKEMKSYNSELQHFWLVGNSAYRFESAHVQRNFGLDPVTQFEPERPACFSFNDIDTGRALFSYSELVEKSSQAI